MAGVHGRLDGLGRLAEPWLLILTSLADGPKHGYAIMTDIRRLQWRPDGARHLVPGAVPAGTPRLGPAATPCSTGT
jgi:hypothetical protein